MRARSLLHAALLASLPALAWGPAWGWGDDGHKIVCEMAVRLLTPDQQREVKTLVRAITRPDGQRYAHLATACTLADSARAKAREEAERGATPAPWSRFAAMDRWHFVNLERWARHVPQGSCGDCVLDAIAFHRTRLHDRTLPLPVRGEALALLGHWVADVHQPLHVGYADDRGGGGIDRLTGIYPEARHLHDVWDNGILARGLAARGLRDWRAYANVLGREVDPAARARWEASEARAWADESYAIATEEAFLYCRWQDGACRALGRERRLDGAYQARFQPVAERRLQQAAVRLARMIAEALRPVS